MTPQPRHIPVCIRGGGRRRHVQVEVLRGRREGAKNSQALSKALLPAISIGTCSAFGDNATATTEIAHG